MNLVETNMTTKGARERGRTDPEEVPLLNTDEVNDMEDYDSKGWIFCEEQVKNELCFHCFMYKSWAYAGCSCWDVDQARHK